jgi:integrase
LEKSEIEELDPWSLYIYAMKAPMTRDRYQTRLAKFFDFVRLEVGAKLEDRARVFAQRGKDDGNWALNSILRFVQYQKDRVDKKEITAATVRNYVKSVKLFCEMADMDISWKKITRGLPRGKKYSDDRIPTLEEIRKVIEYPDRRIKAIVYTMASSGIRIGSWDYLRWGHIRPLSKDGEIIAAKMIVYAGEDDEYFTFISPEALQALNDWMSYRQTSGELINNDSWVMRDLWDTRVAQGRGLVTKPKKLTSLGVKRLMERAIWAQGLRKKLEPGKKRHPYQANHSLRKWFKTRCEIGGMKPINIEKLMNHSVGISNSYYRATENEVLEDYVKAIDSLSINDDKLTLQKQMVELTEKSKEENYIIKGKLFEREKEIHTMQQKYEQDMKDLRKELEPLQVLKKTLEEQGILKASDN